MKRLLPVCSEYFKIIFLHTKPRVSLISFHHCRGLTARELPLRVFMFCSWGVINSVNGVSVWCIKLVHRSHLAVTEQAHFQTHLLLGSALSITVCSNFRFLVDYRKWRLPFLLFELESDSLTYTYFGGCFILVCLSLGNIHHTRAICIPLRAENKSILRSGCL